MRHIQVKGGDVSMAGELNDSQTADAVWEALPIKGKGNVWGKEIYFNIPVNQPEQDGQANVPSGTIAYWPPGKAFCIFWGQRPASAVNVIGKLLGEPTDWAKVPDGCEITIDRKND